MNISTPCKAKNPATCRHHGTPQQTIHQQATSFAAAGSGAPQPVIVEPSNLMASGSFLMNLTSIIDYDYESYSCGGCSDSVCRDSIYEGLRIESVNSHNVLSHMFNCQWQDLPEDLLALSDSLDMNNPDLYEISTSNGYYGQEFDIYLDSEAAEALQSWYYSKNNAKDVSGALEYCRSKGLDTTGLTPLSALKAQLFSEKKRLSDAVSSATRLQHGRVQVKDLDVGSLSKLAESQPRPSVSFNHGTNFDGVALRGKRGEKDKLIDGFHRVHNLIEKGKREGLFLIISSADSPIY
jgi:hypothetical protein